MNDVDGACAARVAVRADGSVAAHHAAEVAAAVVGVLARAGGELAGADEAIVEREMRTAVDAAVVRFR